MQDAIQAVIEILQYSGIFGLMMVFASELVMPFAGFLAWYGHMSLPGVIIAGSLGSTFSSVVIYYVTRFVDHRQIYRFTDRHGKWLGVSARTIRRTERWFDHHAKASVFAGRLLPGVRTAASLIAGYRHMALLPFIAYPFAGTTVSAGLLATLGYYVSGQYESLQTFTIYVSNIFLSSLAIGLILYGIYRHRKYGR